MALKGGAATKVAVSAPNLPPSALTVIYVHGSLIDSLPRKKEYPETLTPELCREIAERYVAFRNGFTTAASVEAQVAILNDYRTYVRDVELRYDKNGLGSRSKYYSSLLEEMLMLLAEGHVRTEIERLGLQTEPLGLGCFKCAISVVASIRGRFITETKDVDFALVLKLDNSDDRIPLVGYEVKKYLDKTMMASVLHTAAQLQIFRPKTHYGLVFEDEGREADAAGSSRLYDREHCLTGTKRTGPGLCPISVREFSAFKDSLYSRLTRALEYLAEEIAADRQKAGLAVDASQTDLFQDTERPANAEPALAAVACAAE